MTVVVVSRTVCRIAGISGAIAVGWGSIGAPHGIYIIGDISIL
jgi:hypothetical protein